MGQIVQAVLYGCKRPEDVALRDEGEGEDLGILERWEDAVLSGVSQADWRKARSHTVPDHDEGDLIGFWVAGVREDNNDSGERMTGAVDLDAIAQTERTKRAVERWERFAAWCAGMGVLLAPARLYLTTTEVA